MMIATWPAAAPRGAVTAFCRTHGISRSRFYEIRALARRVGVVDAVTAERQRQRPDLATVPAVEAAAVRIRKELAEQGWDHGPLSVRHTMLTQGLPAPSRATLARVFTRHGMVVPQPSKRPRSSWRRFTFGYVHECWQLDATEWPLAGGSTLTVFQLLDDHSRFIVGSWIDTGETSAGAVAVFAAAATSLQAPLLLLTDNGLAMNPHRRGSTSQLATYATSVGTRPITSRIYHPQTCGKNERVHSTLKRWLRARPLPATISELTSLVAQFDAHYNHNRPHQALGMRTPADVLANGPQALPPQPPPPPAPPTPPTTAPVHDIRVRRVNQTGSAKTLGGYWIGLGIQHAGSDVVVMVEDTTISIFDHQGTHLRTVTTTPGRTYYGTGRPPTANQPLARINAKINKLPKLSGPNETELSAPD
jgi:transposase InsO family protein